MQNLHSSARTAAKIMFKRWASLRQAKIATILCCVLCLFSCNKLEEGIVISKWHEPTNTQIVLMPTTISNGKTTLTIYQPYVVTDTEDWCIQIKGIYKGEEKTETVYITEKQYNCLSVGNHFKINEDCSTSDNNNSKVSQ